MQITVQVPDGQRLDGAVVELAQIPGGWVVVPRIPAPAAK